MWIYEKKLQYPVKIKNPNAALAKIIISQLGGPDGELAASTRYLSQRFSMPYREVAGILTDVGTEELAHVEMISTILHQLTRNLKPEDIAGTPFAAYFVDHTVGTYPTAASGFPFTASVLAVKGDVLADLHEDLAADAALYFAPHDAQSMYDTLREVITSETLREELRRRGNERIKDFSLQKMVQQTCDVYRSVL